MRPLVLVGILVLLVGVFVLFRGSTFTREREAFRVGEIGVNVEEEFTISPWIGGAVVMAGIVLIAVGAQRRT